MKKLIAKWEAKGGKSFAELWQFDFQGTPAFELTGTYGYCNLGNKISTVNDAINFCENNTIKYMKLDYTSLKRTL